MNKIINAKRYKTKQIISDENNNLSQKISLLNGRKSRNKSGYTQLAELEVNLIEIQPKTPKTKNVINLIIQKYISFHVRHKSCLILSARHIAFVHQHLKHPQLDFEPYSSDLLRAYIAEAKQYESVIPIELTQYIISTNIVQWHKQKSCVKVKENDIHLEQNVYEYNYLNAVKRNRTEAEEIHFIIYGIYTH